MNVESMLQAWLPDSINVKIGRMVEVQECCASASTCPDADGASARVLPDADRLAGMFKALGDPVRLRMAAMIAASPELCVCEITPAFELSSATISHHLKTLREAGLIDCERRGTFVYYWLQSDAVAALSDLLGRRLLP